MGPTRRAQTSSESRRLLIAAAADLFAEQGFRRTTVADVAERAGISRGSIPWHFGNKDGLLEAVIDDFSTTWLHSGPPADSPEEGIDEVLRFLRQPATRLLITLLAEAVEPDSPVHDFYAELHREVRKWVTSWTHAVPLRPGVSHDEFALVLTGAVIGVHQQWRVSPDDIDLDQALSALKSVFLQS